MLPTEPILRLETGMHTAVIKRIATDAQNRWLVTASHDKTARVWDLATGQLLRVLRPPIGEGDEGKLYAVALSPDGRTVAVGGWTSPDGLNTNIYLFDRASGELRQRLTGLPNVVFHLAYAPSGRWLAAVLGEGGLRLYDAAADYREAFRDTEYGANSYGADFTADGGRLATSCDDGQLRLYEASANASVWRRVAAVAAPHGKEPYAVKFAPDGGRLAVGYTDTTRVSVVDGRTLRLLYEPDTAGVNNGNLGRVAWAAEGRSLYAGGRGYINGKKCVRAWAEGGRGAYRDVVAVAQNTIMDLATLGAAGGVAYGAGEPSWGVIGADGQAGRRVTSQLADLRDNQAGFRLAADGAGVQFGYEQWGKSAATFTLAARQLALGTNESWLAPATERGGLAVTDWESTFTPQLNGRALALKQYEMARSAAVLTDGSACLLGASYALRLFGRDGRRLWEKPASGEVWAVNVMADGRLGVAAFGDGTIRWYRLTDGAELLAFFPHGDRQRWVLWTPTGYYDCSSGAEELIGWHVNNGPEAAADFYPVGLFRERFYRPDVVSNILYTLDEAKALRFADDAAQRKSSTLSLTAQLPPVVEIVAPVDNAGVAECEIVVRVRVRRPSGAPLTDIRVMIDGRPVDIGRNVGRGLGAAPASDEIILLPVTVPERDCEISVIAENRYAPSVPATTRILWLGRRAAFVAKPNLYVLAVGVSAYQRTDFNLGYAAKDARDFAAVWQRQKGWLYRDVAVKLLTDGDANKEEIQEGLEWIRGTTNRADVALIFLAGHGRSDKGKYYFCPHNYNPDKLIGTRLPSTDLRETIEDIEGKVLLFVDTCHAGNVFGRPGARALAPDINGFVNELASAENGAIVFASSTGSQVSLEEAKWNNGAFTKAVVEGVSGRAAVGGSDRITVNMLNLYISERVNELTSGKQQPTFGNPRLVPDFPLAVPI